MMTADTTIKVKKGTIGMKVNGKKIKFKLLNALKEPHDEYDCFNIDYVQSAVEQMFQVTSCEPLKAALTCHPTMVKMFDVDHNIDNTM